MQKVSTTLTETKEITAEQARKVLEGEQRDRLAACQQELAKLLEKYGLQLIAEPVITADGRVVANLALGDAPSASAG
jgi:hypothetical protein